MIDENAPENPSRGDDAGDFAKPGQDVSSDNTDHGSGNTESAAAVSGTAGSKAKKPKKKRSKWRILLYVILIMLLILALIAGGAFLYVKNILDNDIKRADLLPGNGSSSPNGVQNILLLGSDSRNDSLRDGSRSDVIQLVHINKNHTKVSVIHFPRDLYVDIPGHGKNKINAAYAYGGPKLMVKTIENLTSIKVDHVAQIGFEGVEKLTNDVGGVNIYVAQPFDEKGYGTWTKGWHKMNGLQARQFMQERHQLKMGDIDRGRNQQQWLAAMFREVKGQGMLSRPDKLNGLLKDTSKNMAVDNDFTSNYMMKLAFSMRNLKQDNITYYTAPFTGFGMEKGAGSVDYVDYPALKKMAEGLKNDDMSGVPNGRVGSPS